MSFIAAAIIGGGASLIGAGINANAASNASQAQVQQQQAALKQQQQMFGTAQNALNLFINAGKGALPTLSGLLTPGTSADFLSTMPGFQFAKEYGNMGATNALTTRGLGASAGPMAKALSDYNQGLAGNQYFNTVNALQGYANMGSGAAGNLAGNALGFGNSVASTYGNIGNAQGAGYLGVGNALSGGFTGGANAFGNYTMMNALMNGGRPPPANPGMYSSGTGTDYTTGDTTGNKWG